MDLHALAGPVIAAVNLSSVTVAYGIVNALGYVVEASTAADFTGTRLSSATQAQAAALAPMMAAAPGPPINLWALAGRQQAMQLRLLMQRRSLR